MNKWGRILDDPLVTSVLKAAGWTPERSINASKWLNLFRKEGVPVPAEAVSVMENLGGLRLRPPKTVDGSLFSASDITFDPHGYYFSGDAPYFRAEGGSFGVNACPIGDWGGDETLVVIEGGRILADVQATARIVGEDIEDALIRMIRRDRLLMPYDPPA